MPKHVEQLTQFESFDQFLIQFEELLHHDRHLAAIDLLKSVQPDFFSNHQLQVLFETALLGAEDYEVALFIAEHLLPKDAKNHQAWLVKALRTSEKYLVTRARAIKETVGSKQDIRAIATGFYTLALDMLTRLEELGVDTQIEAVEDEMKEVSVIAPPTPPTRWEKAQAKLFKSVQGIIDSVKENFAERNHRQDFEPWPDEFEKFIKGGNLRDAWKTLEELKRYRYAYCEPLEGKYWYAFIQEGVQTLDLEKVIEGEMNLRKVSYGDESGIAKRALQKMYDDAMATQNFSLARLIGEKMNQYDSLLSKSLRKAVLVEECVATLKEETPTLSEIQRGLNAARSLYVFDHSLSLDYQSLALQRAKATIVRFVRENYKNFGMKQFEVEIYNFYYPLKNLSWYFTTIESLRAAKEELGEIGSALDDVLEALTTGTTNSRFSRTRAGIH